MYGVLALRVVCVASGGPMRDGDWRNMPRAFALLGYFRECAISVRLFNE
jgi:hypothetical protein